MTIILTSSEFVTPKIPSRIRMMKKSKNLTVWEKLESVKAKKSTSSNFQEDVPKRPLTPVIHSKIRGVKKSQPVKCSKPKMPAISPIAEKPEIQKIPTRPRPVMGLKSLQMHKNQAIHKILDLKTPKNEENPTEPLSKKFKKNPRRSLEIPKILTHLKNFSFRKRKSTSTVAENTPAVKKRICTVSNLGYDQFKRRSV